MSQFDLTSLDNEESPILEFKRQWYWDDDTSTTDMQEKWGELIKDLISLANGYMRYVGKERTLVIGYSETEGKIYSVDTQKIKHLQNLKSFKKELQNKLERYVTPAYTELIIEEVQYDEQSLIVFRIPCPGYPLQLKQSLKTKTRHLDEGAVLVRKGQKTDEVRVATPAEYELLAEEFVRYRQSDAYTKSLASPSRPKQTERSIKTTIQSYIDQNSSLSLADYPTIVRNWKEDIVYEIYLLADQFKSNKEFIYIHSNSIQGKTYAEIKKTGKVKSLETSIILIDRPDIKDIEKRKENIARLFKTPHVFFVDEFGYKFIYKDCMLPYEKFNLPVYVNGLYDSETEKDLPALERLKQWYETDHEPLFVVSGHGGIGKTTLAKQFLDQIFSEENSGILFIDSKEIIHELSRNSTINDVFDFYRAQMNTIDSDISRFNKDLLKLSMDNGSLTVVLDGIDEVIAKLGDRFDVDTFIRSIYEEYSSDLHKTKVLITCRDHFWNEIGKKILIPEIVLKAFNNQLAQEFLHQKLNGEKKKISQAMEMAAQFAIENSSSNQEASKHNYIPFMLDMIGYLVLSKNESSSANNRINSKYLSETNNHDFLILKVCDREIIKLGGLSVDQQIELFIRIAISKSNGVSIYNIKEELGKICGSVDDSLIEKVKGHSLLVHESNSVHFRYDVFDVFFAALYISNFFKRKDAGKFTEDTARIIAGYLTYESSFTSLVCERLSLDDELIIFCMDIIDIAQTYERFDMFKSSIVSMLLSLIQHSGERSSNITTRTELIEKLFETKGQLVGLCLIDVFGNPSIKPTFDFKNKTLTNCNFDNYEYFWECSMNENTRFEKSTFRNIDPRPSVNPKIWDGLFADSCDLSQISHLLNKSKEQVVETRDLVLSELLKVFRLFMERGNFYPRKQEEVRKKLSAMNMLPRLIEKGVIKNFKDPKKSTLRQFKVDDAYRSVIDFIDQGTPSVELSRLIDELS